jgi:hypothetical protein
MRKSRRQLGGSSRPEISYDHTGQGYIPPAVQNAEKIRAAAAAAAASQQQQASHHVAIRIGGTGGTHHLTHHEPPPRPHHLPDTAAEEAEGDVDGVTASMMAVMKLNPLPESLESWEGFGGPPQGVAAAAAAAAAADPKWWVGGQFYVGDDVDVTQASTNNVYRATIVGGGVNGDWQPYVDVRYWNRADQADEFLPVSLNQINKIPPPPGSPATAATAA